MNETPHVCVDMIRTPSPFKERLGALQAQLWGPHALLTVAFLEEPSAALGERIKRFANEWTHYADVSLRFGAPASRAQIRIAFKRGDGSWSQIGRYATEVPKDQPTMNFGWLTDDTPDDKVRRVVLHEFGHALGCIHEHQSPAAGLKWNKPVIYEDYKRLRGWDKQEVDDNLFATYSGTLTVHSEFDPKSIMIYPIPKEYLLDGSEVGWNTDLSETDKELIAKLYPR